MEGGDPRRMRSQLPRAARRTLISISGNEFDGDALFKTNHGIQGEHWETSSDDDNDDRPTVKVSLWRYSLPDDVWLDHDWAVKHIRRMASNVGMDHEDLKDLGRSTKPSDRAEAIEFIGNYHGWDNIDGYPLETTAGGMRRRWRGRL